jgi:hypothetical protein
MQALSAKNLTGSLIFWSRIWCKTSQFTCGMDMPCKDSYTEEFANIITGEVIWWHQRCIVCKKLCRKKVPGALNRSLQYLKLLVLSGNVTLTFNSNTHAPRVFGKSGVYLGNFSPRLSSRREPAAFEPNFSILHGVWCADRCSPSAASSRSRMIVDHPS